MCDLEAIGVPSILRIILNLKVQKIGQFPDESVKIKGEQIHYVNDQMYSPCQS